MNRTRNLFTSLVIALALVAGVAWGQTLTVLSLSEYHGHLQDDDGVGGLAQVATIVEQVRAEGNAVLLLNSGDILIGTTMSSAFRGVPDIEAMNLIGFDAMVLGNHEFDFGIAHMDMLEDLANFPFITTNVVGVYHLGVERAVIKNVGGLDVAIIGITNPNLYNATGPEIRRLTLAPSIEVAQRAVDAVRDHVDVVIALTHQTTREDIALLNGVDGIDLVVGGHVPSFSGMIRRGSDYDVSTSSGPSAISDFDGALVKAPSFTEAVARVDLILDDGDIVLALNRDIPVEGYDPDPAVAALVAEYEVQLSARLDDVIGTAAVTLDGVRENVRTVETNLGNLIADSLRATFPNADIGFANGGGIRNPIDQGDVTLGNVIEVHPFGNTIVTFDLTGAQVVEALENAVSRVEDVSGRFLQVSGMSYVWDPAQDPGSRVVSVEVGGAPIDMGASYTVATNNFIAGGGDGFEVFTLGQNFFDSQQLDADVLAAYIIDQGTVAPQVEGRIVRLGN
jgi:2',3'-cyclic-nucleotide 2'-phosphodiesterase (5'-nucleotidase family)